MYMRSFKTIILATLLLCAAAGTITVWQVKTNYTRPTCRKTGSGIGTCARIMRKESIVGLNKDYFIELTPTNNTEYQGNIRKKIIAIEEDCAIPEALEWQSLGLQLNQAGNACLISNDVVGQW